MRDDQVVHCAEIAVPESSRFVVTDGATPSRTFGQPEAIDDALSGNCNLVPLLGFIE